MGDNLRRKGGKGDDSSSIDSSKDRTTKDYLSLREKLSAWDGMCLATLTALPLQNDRNPFTKFGWTATEWGKKAWKERMREGGKETGMISRESEVAYQTVRIASELVGILRQQQAVIKRMFAPEGQFVPRVARKKIRWCLHAASERT